MTEAVNLSEFLLARFAEDEKAAKSAAPAPWEYQDVESVGGGRICDTDVEIADMVYDPADHRVDPRIRKTVRAEQADLTAEHIVRWDPARVLADLDAKRRIVEGFDCYVTTRDAGWMIADVFKLLALPYADHPDYRDEWRP